MKKCSGVVGRDLKYKIEFRIGVTPEGSLLQEFLSFFPGIGWQFSYLILFFKKGGDHYIS